MKRDIRCPDCKALLFQLRPDSPIQICVEDPAGWIQCRRCQRLISFGSANEHPVTPQTS